MKKALSAFLTLVMLLVIVPLADWQLKANAMYATGSFNAATYSSDPGQYMANIALAQANRTGASFGYTDNWCAYFIYDCAVIAGQDSAISANGYVPSFYSEIMAAGGTLIYSGRDKTGSLADSRIGDICFIDTSTGGNTSRDHVEIVYSVSGSSVSTVGGNSYTGKAPSPSTISTRYVAKHDPKDSDRIVYIVRPNYQGSSNQPTYARLYVDKFSHKKDEVVTFTCETDGAINNLWIYCPDGSPLVYQDIGRSKEITFGWIGHYQALVQTWIGEENVISKRIDFVIGKPTYAELQIDKFSHKKDEVVTFTALCDGDINNLFIYCPDDSPLIYQDIGQSKEITFGWVGHYRALVQTWNESGNVISELIDFVIGSPTYATLSSDKTIYKKDEIATFTCHTDGDLNTVWIYYPDGSRDYYWNIGSSVSLSFSETGKYRALVQTWNESGNVISEFIDFIVEPTTYLVAFNGSDTIIDQDNHQIFGLPIGSTATEFEERCVAVTDGTVAYEYPTAKKALGTGTKVNVYNNDNVLVDSYTVVVFGDVDGDSWYDGTDAYFVSLVANGLVSADALTDAQRAACDANHDGTIDNADAALLERAGLLLSQVDQTAPIEELQTDSVYLEYCSLIDQSMEIVEPDQPTETDEPQPATQSVLSWLKALFTVVLNWLLRVF